MTLTFGLGYGFGYGDTVSSTYSLNRLDGQPYNALDSLVSGQVPLALGAGYRPIPFLSFGAAFGYARLLLEDCRPGCSGEDVRIGGEARFHVVPGRRFSPWLSLGAGYEWFHYHWVGSSGDVADDLALVGYDVDFQTGGDIRVTPSLTLGPFAGLRVGRYGHVSGHDTSRGSTPVDADVPDAGKATHGWVTFGVRGVFTYAPR